MPLSTAEAEISLYLLHVPADTETVSTIGALLSTFDIVNVLVVLFPFSSTTLIVKVEPALSASISGWQLQVYVRELSVPVPLLMGSTGATPLAISLF